MLRNTKDGFSLGRVRDLALSSLYRRPVVRKDCLPVISFTFDDFPRTALLVGGDLLEQVGARGTYYVATGLMGTHNRLGEQFHSDDLLLLKARGHEVGLHGHAHLSARRCSLPTFIRDVTRGKEALEGLIADGSASNFAYPYGEATLSSKRALGPHMRSCRGTIPGLNGPTVDLNLLHANPLYGGAEQLTRVRELIAQNRIEGSWLIFYSHDVAQRPSPFGCTPDLLRMTIDSALESGAKIVTIEEVVSDLTALAQTETQLLCPAEPR